MAVDFLPDVLNTFIGPGTGFSVRTDFIGPIPSGSLWQIEVRVPVSEQVLSVGRHYSQLPIETIYPNVDISQSSVFTPNWRPLPPVVAIPTTAQLVATLFDPSNVVIDQGSTQIKWQATPEGVAWVQSLAPIAGQAGFTPTDRVSLENVLAAVRTVVPPAFPGGPQLLAQVIDLVRGPPRSLLRPFGSVLISGRGELSAQPSGALHSFGGTWSISTIPAGYGKDDGRVVEYHRRLGQFSVIREGAGDDFYIDVLEDSHRGNDYILWQFPNPTQIQYDIAPGVVLLWEWLV